MQDILKTKQDFPHRLGDAEACFILTCRCEADRNAAVSITEIFHQQMKKYIIMINTFKALLLKE